MSALLFLLAVALLIIIGQYRLAMRFGKWWQRFLIFYGSFVLFCWSQTLSDIFEKGEPLLSLPSISGLVMRGFFIVMYAHIVPFFIFPLLVIVVTIANQWLFPLHKLQPPPRQELS